MRLVSFKIGVCLVSSLLWLGTGCKPEAATTIPEQATTAPSPVTIVRGTTTIVTPEPELVASLTPAPTPTPTVEPMPIPEPDGPPYTYHTISEGETLGYIALLYNTDVAALVAMNKLAGEDALIQVGQMLRVPLQSNTLSPDTILMPDSEVVYSPGSLGFDLTGFIKEQGGYLATYSQYVNNELLTGPEIVDRVAQQFSVGPRLLLALLEHYSGWVTNPAPTAEQISHPLGPHNPRGEDLHRALGFTANRVNAGYYGYKRDGFWVFELADRSRAITPRRLNAGTVGVQNILAVYSSDRESWQQELGPQGFLADYKALFGDPFAYAVEPIVPASLVQPPLGLPWPEGEQFYFTGGPHPAYAHGSGWAAVDFGPPDVLGNCFYSEKPATAAAAGVIIAARQGEVYLDLDGDGHIQTGWVLFYMHVVLDSEKPVRPGQQVAQGDIIGYPSCEGGLSNSSHVHLARRYNGEWIAAGGPVPMELSGWVVQPNLVPYEGTIRKGDEIREACECWDDSLNLIVNTGPP